MSESVKDYELVDYARGKLDERRRKEIQRLAASDELLASRLMIAESTVDVNAEETPPVNIRRGNRAARRRRDNIALSLGGVAAMVAALIGLFVAGATAANQTVEKTKIATRDIIETSTQQLEKKLNERTQRIIQEQHEQLLAAANRFADVRGNVELPAAVFSTAGNDNPATIFGPRPDYTATVAVLDRSILQSLDLRLAVSAGAAPESVYLQAGRIFLPRIRRVVYLGTPELAAPERFTIILYAVPKGSEAPAEGEISVDMLDELEARFLDAIEVVRDPGAANGSVLE